MNYFIYKKLLKWCRNRFASDILLLAEDICKQA